MRAIAGAAPDRAAEQRTVTYDLNKSSSGLKSGLIRVRVKWIHLTHSCSRHILHAAAARVQPLPDRPPDLCPWNRPVTGLTGSLTPCNVCVCVCPSHSCPSVAFRSSAMTAFGMIEQTPA